MTKRTHAASPAPGTGSPFPSASRLDALVEVAKALGHPGRLRVLSMLRGGPLCVCQITSVLGLSGSTVSAHLADLRRAGLVAEQKRGKWVHYRLTRNEPLRRLTAGALRLLDDDPVLNRDARVIEALRSVPVDELCRAGLDLAALGVKVARDASAKGRAATHVE